MKLVPARVNPVTHPAWLAGSTTIPWPDAWARLSEARNYWIASVRPDGLPHTRPVWGVCTEHALLLSVGGGYWTQRNIRKRPQVSVHPEPAEGIVVVVEGLAVEMAEGGERGAAVAAYNKKYGEQYADGPGWWSVRPARVYAWETGTESFRGTRYDFDES